MGWYLIQLRHRDNKKACEVLWEILNIYIVYTVVCLIALRLESMRYFAKYFPQNLTTRCEHL